jgi:tetratricopeptide (TPR) repeat protein
MKLRHFVAVLLVALAIPSFAFAVGEEAAEEEKGSTYDRGKKAADSKEWKKAIGLFQKAVSANPKDHRAYNMLGYSLRHVGNYKEAISAYNAALTLKPDYAEALEYRGGAYLKAGNLAAAMKDYQTLVKMGSPLAKELKEEIDKARKASGS